MKSYLVPIYSALKLLFAAAVLVLVSDLAGAEMASIYGGRDGLWRPSHSQRGTFELRRTDGGASHVGIWHAGSRLP